MPSQVSVNFNCQIPARTNVVSRRTKHRGQEKKLQLVFTLATSFFPPLIRQYSIQGEGM